MRRVTTFTFLATRMLNPLLQVLNPSVRPVTMALLSPLEKAAIARVVRVMLEYNLSYTQLKTPTVRA
jgi:hypothetical protein